MDPGEGLSHGIQKRVIQHYAVLVKSIDWDTMQALVEFKESPGLLAQARIATISGSKGAIYPPISVGDVMLAEVTGHDLDQLLRDRNAKVVRNPYLYDKSDVVIGFSLYAEQGEGAGRKATTPPGENEWLLARTATVEIRINVSTGEVVIQTAGNIYLGGKTGAKKVIVDGDDVNDTTDKVVASAGTKVYVGSP